MKDMCNVTNCNIYKSINMIKSRYSSVLIISLKDTSKSFSTLANEFDYLTNMQLSRTLNTLVQHCLITKDNNYYSLTTAGKELVPILMNLELWYDEYINTLNYTK